MKKRLSKQSQSSYSSEQKNGQQTQLRMHLPFQEDISSIQFVRELKSPDDSVMQKIIQTPDDSILDENNQEGYQSQNASFLASDIMTDEAHQQSSVIEEEQLNNSSSNLQIQRKQIILKQQKRHQQKNYYDFKSSSLKFMKLNKYMLNFLRKTSEGMLILPEYQSQLQDYSYLGAQGKILQLRINKADINENGKNQKQKQKGKQFYRNILDELEQDIKQSGFKKKKDIYQSNNDNKQDENTFSQKRDQNEEDTRGFNDKQQKQ